MTFSPKSRGFTLVEILATIAIIAVLIATIVPMVGNYTNTAKEISDKQTLTVLNDALTRYKTQGGDRTMLTVGASIGNVISALKTPVTWAGVRHQFLQAGTTYSADSLKALGEGSQYRFYAYDNYSQMEESDIAGGTATSEAPYGTKVGYLVRDADGDAQVSIETSTGYLAYQVDGGAVSIVAAGSGATNNLVIPESATTRFWSCTGAADNSFSGDVTSFDSSFFSASTLNFDGLTGLQTLILYGFYGTTSVGISGCTSLQTLNCTSSELESLDISNLKNLTTLTSDFSYIITINASGCTNLSSIVCQMSDIENINASGCSSLQTIEANNSSLVSLNLTGATQLQKIYAGNSSLASLDASGLTSLYLVAYYNSDLAWDGAALNAFYSSLEAPNLVPTGQAHLWEVYSPDTNDNGMGNTALITSGWQFGGDL